MTIQVLDTDFLLNIDIQRDFCPGGALEVAEGDLIIPTVNDLISLFAARQAGQGASKDIHSPDHASFARTTGAEEWSTVVMKGPDGHSYSQVLWPVHCVQGTLGVEFHPNLDTKGFQIIVGKGFDPKLDSHSAFYSNDKITSTGLTGYLRQRGFKRVFLTGLAEDYCVGFSAVDAVRDGFEAYVISDATKAIDLNGSRAAIHAEFERVGVHCITSDQII